MPQEREQLIKAISEHRVFEVATKLVNSQSDGEDGTLASRVLAACDEITQTIDEEISRLEQNRELAAVGFTPDTSRQAHRLIGRLKSWSEVAAVVSALRDKGYVTQHSLDASSENSLYRFTDNITLIHLDNEPIVVELSWPPGPFAKLPSAARPGYPDFSFTALPKRLWLAYLLVRPIRLVADRAGLSPERARSLGPILSTPRSLIGPLLDFADVGPNDHLVDLGCGEGRVLIEAAKATGCRVTGVESDARLVERARQSIEEELGSDSSARIVHADARDFDLTDTTVVFLFVPVESIEEIVASIRQSGFAGRIVSHEHSSLPSEVSPDTSEILVAHGAITVAHRWDVAVT